MSTAPHKRVRTASSPSSSAATTPKVTLSGGEAHHSSLAALWRKDKLTDIAICAEGVEFKAHRAALASSSGYFLSLFDSGMRDAASPTHAIEGLRSPVLEAVLAFVYEGSCEVEAGLLTEVLDAAARLVIDSLKTACAFAIQAQLAPCNALDVWRLADLYTLPGLEKAAVESALGGFEELPPQSASGAQVLALVQEDRLVAKSEETVFQWVVRWWDASERPVAELLAAMKHVRFAAMDAGFVQTTVRAWPALCSQEGIAIVLASSLDAGHMLPRLGFEPSLVYVLGDVHRACGPSTVDVYEPLTDAWKQVASLPTNRSKGASTPMAVTALDGKLYAMGGHGDDGYLSTADVYDPQSDSWQPLADMAKARGSSAAAAAGGKVYAIGGEGRNDVGHCVVVTRVEAFDPLLGAWAEVAILPSTSMSDDVACRCNHTVTAVDGKIYAIGGLKENGGHPVTVVVFDYQAGSWQQVASMPTDRYSHAAAAMGGKIYVSGGITAGTSTSTLFVFDPQANTWSELTSMGTPRSEHASAAIRGKLYVFGGGKYGNDRLASVEAYDPISNTWAYVSDLPRGARGAFVAVAL